MAPLTQATDRNLLSTFDDSKRLVAKLMARENITVLIVDGIPTASFDPVARVLRIPNWPFITIDQYDTQLCHEVAHALWTDNSFLELQAKKRQDKERIGGLFTYINVVEDARIERKMREAYPGVTRVFYNGRRDFSERGPIFQVADTKHVLIDGVKVNVAKLPLIDRVNSFYKIGAFIDVPFKPEEHKWIALIDKCYSTQNACEIAEAMWKAEKARREEQKQQQKAQQKKKDKGQKSQQSGEPGDDESGEESGDESGDESGESESKKSKKSKSKDADKKDDKEKKSGKSGDGDDAEEEGEEPGAGDESGDESGDGDEDGEGSSSGAGDVDEDEGDEEGSGAGAGDEDGDGGKDDEDGEDGDVDGHAPLGSAGDSAEEHDPSSRTDKAIENMLRELAAQQKMNAVEIRNLLIRPLDERTVKARTVTAETWCTLVETHLGSFGGDDGATARIEEKWNELYMPTVRHMAQEFNRKKQAANLMHARTGKTGRLNMERLASYQVTDDLFKSVTSIPNGQSHGIVMIIDGSSSMDDVFGQVVDQTLLFAKFSFLCNIPFEAYMFTDRSRGSEDEYGKFWGDDRSQGQTIVLPDSGKLVGLINTATDRSSFKRQVRAVLALRAAFVTDEISLKGGRGRYDSIPYANLGSTPLYCGMMLMERHVERMKRTLHLDKVDAIVVTDGGDTAHLQYTENVVNRSSGQVKLGVAMLAGQPIVVRDTKTKKSFVLAENNQYGSYSQPSNALPALLFDVMKERHGARGIMLYLVDKSSAATNGVRTMVRSGGTALSESQISEQMTKTNQVVLPKDGGVADCCIVVLSSALQLVENGFAALSLFGLKNGDTSKVTAAFIRENQRAGANRVFVNTIIPFLA